MENDYGNLTFILKFVYRKDGTVVICINSDHLEVGYLIRTNTYAFLRNEHINNDTLEQRAETIKPFIQYAEKNQHAAVIVESHYLDITVTVCDYVETLIEARMQTYARKQYKLFNLRNCSWIYSADTKINNH